MICTVDIDTGGTFTDGVYNLDGRIETVKVPTTPHDLTECFFENLKEAAHIYGMPLEKFLQHTSVVRYSNTIGTNTIIQGNGPRLGLIVNKGYEETLYGSVPVWDQSDHPLTRFIQKEMVIGIKGKVDDQGQIEEPVDPEEILEKIQQLIDAGARAIVISLDHSWLNPRLEREVKQIVKQEFPNFYLGTPSLFLSTDICDYPDAELRTNTTLINAYIHREMARSLYKAEEKIRQSHYQHPLLIVHSNGGAARVAKTRAINTYNSGPVAGISGAQKIGRLLGYQNIITADMGGTSLDIGMIINGTMNLEPEPVIEKVRTNHPMVKIDAIGAGGGSIASVEGERIQVGPESAGASPGPVCFDRGGRKPTVTDANLILGYLDPDYFLGGKMKLNLLKAERAISRHIANPLGISVVEAAWRIKQNVDAFIAENILQLLNNQGGINAKETVLFPYGGGGATHCAGFSKGLPIDAIVISPYSSVFSAYGSSTVDVMHKYMHNRPIELNRKESEQEFTEALNQLIGKAVRDMRGEGFKEEDIQFFVDIIIDQEGTRNNIRMKMTSGNNFDITSLFTDLEAVEKIESILLNAVAEVPHHQLETLPESTEDVSSSLKGYRKSYWGPEHGWIDTPVYLREKLPVGKTLNGPALVDARDTTYVLPAGYSLRLDSYGNAVIKEVQS